MIDEKQLSIKVNEIFHNYECYEYDKRHPEILKQEKEAWQIIIKKIFAMLSFSNSVNILDIGSGTGFVAEQFLPFLKNKKYTFFCSDISQGMLDIVKQKINNHNFVYKKIENYKIDVLDNSIDIITVNSVLHHIPDLEPFFYEINKKLKKNSILIINHEPNKYFFSDLFLLFNYILLDNLLNPKKIIIKILEYTKLYNFIKKIVNKKDIYNPIYEKVNTELLKKKIIDKKLSIQEIDRLVDFHTHNNKNTIYNIGFDVFKLKKKYLPQYKIISYTTYNHLSKISLKNKFTKIYNEILRKCFPMKGAHFCIILQKI